MDVEQPSVPSELIFGTLVDDPDNIGDLISSISTEEIDTIVRDNKIVILRYQTENSTYFGVFAYQSIEPGSGGFHFTITTFSVNETPGSIDIKNDDTTFYFNNGTL